MTHISGFHGIVDLIQSLMCIAFIAHFKTFRYSAYRIFFLIFVGGAQGFAVMLSNILSGYPYLANMLLIAELAAAAFVFLRGNIFKRLGLSLLPSVVGAAVSFISMFTTSILHGLPLGQMLSDLSSSFYVIVSVQILCFYMFGILLEMKRGERLDDVSVSTVIAVLMISLVMTVVLHNTLNVYTFPSSYSGLYGSTVMLLIAVLDVLAYRLIADRRRKEELERSLEISSLREHYQSGYIENARQQYEQIRKLRHDNKNSFLTISELIASGEADKAYSFAVENSERLSLMSPFVQTKNPVVNALVNSKLSYAAGKGIRVSCLSAERIEGIRDTDLCSVLGNALDNAIAACLSSKRETPELSLEISCEQERFYTFTVKNTIDSSVLDKNPELASSKRDKSEHGFGTSIIRETAERYGGRADFFEEEGMFCCRVDMIAKPSV